MSKSIIIIDTPETCAECRASYCADIWYCYAGKYRKILTSKEIYAKPDWCPLRNLPPEFDPHRIGIVDLDEKTDVLIYDFEMDDTHWEEWTTEKLLDENAVEYLEIISPNEEEQ